MMNILHVLRGIEEWKRVRKRLDGMREHGNDKFATGMPSYTSVLDAPHSQPLARDLVHEGE